MIESARALDDSQIGHRKGHKDWREVRNLKTFSAKFERTNR